MKDIFIVTPEQDKWAQKAEKTILELPNISNILFVGTRITNEEYNWVLHITIGCTRAVEPTAIESLVRLVIDNDQDLAKIKNHIKITTYKGSGKYLT